MPKCLNSIFDLSFMAIFLSESVFKFALRVFLQRLQKKKSTPYEIFYKLSKNIF